MAKHLTNLMDAGIRRDWQKIKRLAPHTYRRLIEHWEKQSGGKFKKVTDVNTGRSYRVPVEVIVTEGIQAQDLDKFDRWIDDEPPQA